jgi:TPR repeat protein
VTWLHEAAAEQRHADAECNLGAMMYHNGKTQVAQDAAGMAVAWYREAAEQGHAHGRSATSGPRTTGLELPVPRLQ